MRSPLATELADIRSIRALNPDEIGVRLNSRRRRPLLGEDGRLMIIAADHPARGAMGVRSAPMAMANRDELLGRLAIALSRPGVDGVLGTPDIVEDLLLLGALEGKVVIGSMNRGGLQGAAFELDDRFTAYDPSTVVESRLDGGKMLCRICLDDAGSVATMESCAQAVTQLAHAGVVSLVEPFWSRRVEGKVVNDLSVEAIVKSVAIASALGARASHTWLKLPVVDRMDEVMAATTLPTLLLGGDPVDDPDATYASWETALGAPGVRGLVVGRALLYPPTGNVAEAVDIAAGLVHATSMLEETKA